MSPGEGTIAKALESSQVQFAAFGGLAVVFTWYLTQRVFSAPPLPPAVGPNAKGFKYMWHYFADQARTLSSPIISKSSMGSTIVVINSKALADEMLGKGSMFASRPRWPMVELLGRQNNVGFTYYGKKLQKLRAVLQKHLSTGAVAGFTPLLDEYALSICQSIYQHPEDFNEIAEHQVQELVMLFAYGCKPDGEYLKLSKTVAQQTGEALQPGKWLVNFIPALAWVPAWMPGAGFQRWARDARELFLKMVRGPYYALRDDLRNGIQRGPSFVQQSLAALPEGHPLDDEEIIMYAAGSLFSAGTETLTAVFLTFVWLMSKHPDIQTRVYEQIISKIGQDRLPSLGDLPALPLVDHIVQEVHRFYPAIRLVPHSCNEEERYDGYRIPKHSWVMANTWAMLHNEEQYPDPETFNPDRYQSSPPPPDPRLVVYGFGRRRCPGAHFADAFVFLVISRFLALFEVQPYDDSGADTLDFTAGLVAFPKAFSCKVVRRANTAHLVATSKVEPVLVPPHGSR